MPRRFYLPLIVLALISCTEISETPTPTITLDVDHHVAGSSLLIRSRGFRSRLPSVMADSTPLIVTVANDTTVMTQLPTNVRGPVRIQVNGADVAVLDVRGFVSFRPRTIDLQGNPYQYPRHGPASLILSAGNRWDSLTIFQFLPGTGELRPLVSGYMLDNVNTRSIGPTHNPDVFLLQPAALDPVEPWRNRTLEAWNLNGVPTRVAEFRNMENYRYAAQLNDSIFLHAFHHTVRASKLGVGRVYEDGYEETNGIVLSPRGDRAAIKVHGSPTGPPVFNALTGHPAYHISSVRGAEGVAFSARGDTLFVLGYNVHDVDSHILVLDAASGQEFMRLRLPYWSEDMAVDLDNQVIYLPVAPRGYISAQPVPHILVVDIRKMQIVGDMAAKDPKSFNCFYRGITVADDGVFFVCGGDTWRFDRVLRSDLD